METRCSTAPREIAPKATPKVCARRPTTVMKACSRPNAYKARATRSQKRLMNSLNCDYSRLVHRGQQSAARVLPARFRRSAQRQELERLRSIDAVDPEIVVEREYAVYAQALGGQDDGAIRQIHRDIGILLHQDRHSRDFLWPWFVDLENSLLDKMPKALLSAP